MSDAACSIAFALICTSLSGRRLGNLLGGLRGAGRERWGRCPGDPNPHRAPQPCTLAAPAEPRRPMTGSGAFVAAAADASLPAVPTLRAQFVRGFARPRRRQFARAARVLVAAWALLAISAMRPELLGLVFAIIFPLAFPPVGTSLAVLAAVVAGGVLIAYGLVFALLGMLWMVLYNRAGGTNPYARAAIVEVWFVAVAWAGSAFQYDHPGPLGMLGFLGIPLSFLVVMLAPVEMRATEVPAAELYASVLVPLGIVGAVSVACAVLVLPEYATDAARESCLFVLKDLLAVFGPRGSGAEERARRNKLGADVLQLGSDIKGCRMDVGFLRDQPTAMAKVGAALVKLAGNGGLRFESPAIVVTCEAAIAALDIRRPWYDTSLYVYEGAGPHPETSIASAREALDARAAEVRDRAAPAKLGRDDLDVFAENEAIGDARALLDAVEALLAVRRLRFYFLGSPGREPKKPKVKKEPTERAKRGPWHVGKLLGEALYRFHVCFTSPASRFGFKRALAYFLASVWAFLPGTADYYYENNLAWILITVILVLNPQLGSGVVKSANRLAGTAIGALWTYLAYLASRNAPSADYMRVQILMYLPLSVLAVGVNQLTKFPYAGFVMSLTFAIVATAPKLSLEPSWSWQRALWVFVGVLGCLVLQIIVFPELAATSVRQTLSRALGTLGSVVFAAHSRTKSAAEMDALLQALQADLTTCRIGPLAGCTDEPELDRPWDLRAVLALMERAQRLRDAVEVAVAFVSRGGEPQPHLERVVVLVAWKLDALAASLQARKPLGRMPRLADRGIGGAGVRGDVGGGERLLYAGAGAALLVVLEEADAIEALVARLYGREWVAEKVRAERTGDIAARAVWRDTVPVLEERGVKGEDRGGLPE
ncbi:hypothetical protein DFJ74DRAFT_753117 [Hyaloraphidium curvatum]|nr:hypothetical protein DFJ74DRAFT_753117 [Hyaloraphidium curvatum]